MYTGAQVIQRREPTWWPTFFFLFFHDCSSFSEEMVRLYNTTLKQIQKTNKQKKQNKKKITVTEHKHRTVQTQTAFREKKTKKRKQVKTEKTILP
jgi:hypothetical protein